MALSDLTSRDAVLKALAEYDQLGEQAFLKKYGFGPARAYFLVHEGKRYASKAVVAAAYGYQHGTPLRAYDFSGGDATVASKLEQLGFKVEGPASAFDESLLLSPQTQFWWVSQNKTFNEEREGGYLWAPLRDKGGNVPHHWETMAQVKAGDVIFSYAGQSIRAISIAKSAVYSCTRPEEFEDAEAWMNDGRRVDVEYKDLETPLFRHDFVEELLPLLPALYSPLTSGGTGNQGYLFKLPPKAGRWLLNRTHTAHLLDDQELVT